MHGLAGRAQWVVAHHEGQEKLQGEMGQGVPLQEEAQVEVHESQGGWGVQVEPGGLELDWWLETWRQKQKGRQEICSSSVRIYFNTFLRVKIYQVLEQLRKYLSN